MCEKESVDVEVEILEEFESRGILSDLNNSLLTSSSTLKRSANLRENDINGHSSNRVLDSGGDEKLVDSDVILILSDDKSDISEESEEVECISATSSDGSSFWITLSDWEDRTIGDHLSNSSSAVHSNVETLETDSDIEIISEEEFYDGMKKQQSNRK